MSRKHKKHRNRNQNINTNRSTGSNSLSDRVHIKIKDKTFDFKTREKAITHFSSLIYHENGDKKQDYIDVFCSLMRGECDINIK